MFNNKKWQNLRITKLGSLREEECIELKQMREDFKNVF